MMTIYIINILSNCINIINILSNCIKGGQDSLVDNYVKNIAVKTCAYHIKRHAAPDALILELHIGIICAINFVDHVSQFDAH